MSKTIGLQGMLQHPARNQVCLVLPNAWIHCGDLILELSSPRRVEFHVSQRVPSTREGCVDQESNPGTSAWKASVLPVALTNALLSYLLDYLLTHSLTYLFTYLLTYLLT